MGSLAGQLWGWLGIKGKVSPLVWPTSWILFLVLALEAIWTADVILFCSYSATVRFASWLGEEVRVPALLKIMASRHTDTVPPVGIRRIRILLWHGAIPIPGRVALALSTSGARLVNRKFLYNVSMSRESFSCERVQTIWGRRKREFFSLYSVSYLVREVKVLLQNSYVLFSIVI